MHKDSLIYVAGHRGLVGSAVMRGLNQQGYDNLIVRTHAELDLTEQSAVRNFFQDLKPEVVIMAAAIFMAVMATIRTAAASGTAPGTRTA